MHTSSTTRYPWNRLTHKRDMGEGALAFFFDARGWFRPSSLQWQGPGSSSVMFRPLADLHSEPVIVLMSPSGLGKSHALEDEHSLLDADTARLVDLRELGAIPDADGRLRDLAWPPADGADVPFHVLMDGFDEVESLVIVGVLKRWLTAMDPADRGRLRLRLATRPGVPANDALLRMLKTFWPADEDVAVRVVAPLTPQDVRAAAKHRGIANPDDFVGQLGRRGLAFVASAPVMLTTLLDQAAAGQQLPLSAADVYRQACDRLCDESPGRPSPTDLSRPQLVRSAERLAAAMQFCGEGVATTDREALLGGQLRLADIAADAPGVPWTQRALTWLTDSALLKPLSGGRWQFAHQQLQQFLAAEHLIHRDIPAASLRNLLLAGYGDVRQVRAEHRGVADWVAWQRPEVLEDVLACDPWVLLGPGLPTQPAGVRARVVDALMTDVARRGGLPPQYSPDTLHRLDHPGLSSQLSGVLAAGPSGSDDRSGYARITLALAISRACGDRAPAVALLDLAERSQDPQLAEEALYCLPRALDAAAVARLRALSTGGDLGLAGAALLALWPQELTTEELFKQLRSARVGRLRYRLERRLAVHGSQADTTVVLKWLRDEFGGQVLSPETTFGLLTWAIDRMLAVGPEPAAEHTAALTDVFVAIAASTEAAYHVLLSDVRDRLAERPTWRRRLAREVLGHLAPGSQAVHNVIYGQLGLFALEDSHYWALQAADQPDSGLAALGNPVQLPCPSDPEQLADLEGRRGADPVLYGLTSRWFAPSPSALREQLDAEAAEAVAARKAEIKTALTRLLKGQPPGWGFRDWWRTIVAWVHQDPDQSKPTVDLALDLASTPSFPEPGTELYAALITVAGRAVRETPLVMPEMVGPNGVFLSEVPELCALTLAQTDDLSTPRLAGLALALALAPCRYVDGVLRRELLVRLLGASAPDFAAMLRAALDRIQVPSLPDVLVGLRGLRDDIDQLLLAWLSEPAKPLDVWRTGMRTLAPFDLPSLPVHAEITRVATEPDDGGGGLARWAVAIDLLLIDPTSSPSELWDKILSTPERTEAWARAAEEWLPPGMGALVHAPIAHWPAAYLGLTASQAGVLFDRLDAAGLIDDPTPDPQFPARRFPGEGRRAFHNQLPDLISHMPTDEAGVELRRLAETHPRYARLAELVTDHAVRLAQSAPSLTWNQFRVLTEDRDRRVVRTAAELMTVVLEALDALSKQVQDANGWSTLLWQQDIFKPLKKDSGEVIPVRRWPLWEDGFSDFVRNWLQNRLSGRRVVINREVQVRPAPDAQRGDILVQADAEEHSAADPVTVIIEVKGCWNKEITDALPQQLVADYLGGHPSWAGIFLVGFFDGPHWDKDLRRSRHQARKTHTITTIEADLATQVQEQVHAGHTVAALVLDCRLPKEPVHRTGRAAH